MRILHVFRTPVGGLFRHVRDLARGQQQRGHAVGLICDSSSGGTMAEGLLAEISGHCTLGIVRIPMSRLPGLGDLAAARHIALKAKTLTPDIIHCHGAKGGLFGRLAARRLGVPSVYTPHGGSLHYGWGSPAGALFLATEKALARIGSGLLFVCEYERQAYNRKVGLGSKPNAVVHNGLWPDEFTPAVAAPDAADLLFIGDMRELKGVDVLLVAIARLADHRRVTACLVGDGPDLQRFRDQAKHLGVAEQVTFPGRMAAREAFRRGRILVLPSRAESFPYVVLEGLAAGLPVIASAVGGIPEILPAELMAAGGNADQLAQRIGEVLAGTPMLNTALAAVRERVHRTFTVAAMTDQVLAFYGQVRLDRGRTNL